MNNYKLSKIDKEYMSSITDSDREKLKPAGDLEIIILFQLRDRIKIIYENLELAFIEKHGSIKK